MVTNSAFPRPAFGRDSMPLDAARAAFGWLTSGPQPVSVDGRLFPGLPARRVPVDELRERLLERGCTQALRHAVWAHLVLLSRTGGGTWTVACVGVALPALTRIAATLSAKFVGDPSDIHAAVLAGFVEELAHIDLRKPRIMLRLRWAAYRAGHTAVREALDAPVPSGGGFRSATPQMPWGHPDFVLARAVAEGAITAEDAELIGATRLEGLPLATAGEDRGLTYEAVKKVRLRAEYRLLAYLRDDAPAEASAGPAERDLADQVADAVLISRASRAVTAARASSPSVTELSGHVARKARRRVSRKGQESGVQGCGRKPAASATTTPPDRPAAPSDLTPEVPRCA
ncbi:MAG: hypothetical protein JWQ81_933 [Amycolatopsis sp.]|uniref:hypothetical protein n=1 Tax=Amycolatopsis sp. TaxID=37632 RepID=UPI002626E83D|nr:hypothetical protein [Amycolatopsis sp.]MCU1680194.1 hypothetical protein [Amycolatopsis sp.]